MTSTASSVAPQLRAQLLRALFQPDLPDASPHAVQMILTRSVLNAAQPAGPLNEVDNPDYARVTIPLTSASWALSGTDTMLNLSPLTFPAPTTPWGLVVGWAMLAGDGSSTLYAAGALQAISIPAGAAAPSIGAFSIGVRLYD